ncbi:MAG: hypothetical protein LUQ19_05380, partial [Methanoregula sp.]|nr:hypothetical protein [Methanoregula sp.]
MDANRSVSAFIRICIVMLVLVSIVPFTSAEREVSLSDSVIEFSQAVDFSSPAAAKSDNSNAGGNSDNSNAGGNSDNS